MSEESAGKAAAILGHIDARTAGELLTHARIRYGEDRLLLREKAVNILIHENMSEKKAAAILSQMKPFNAVDFLIHTNMSDIKAAKILSQMRASTADSILDWIYDKEHQTAEKIASILFSS